MTPADVALVTGSTSGLGRAIATRLAADGARVVITGRDPDRGAAAVASLGTGAAFIPADLTDEQAAGDLVSRTVEQFGSLTILVNNAVTTWAGAGAGSVTEVDTGLWEAALRVNVTAAMWLCRSAIPVMQANGGGVIVNISSRAAERANPGLAAYVTSKGALNALTRSIAVDYARDGIRCNTVSPGYILHEQRDADITPERRARLEAMHLTRLATAEDIAGAVAFLCSRDAECITGINLPVDGGSSIARATGLG